MRWPPAAERCTVTRCSRCLTPREARPDADHDLLAPARCASGLPTIRPGRSTRGSLWRPFCTPHAFWRWPARAGDDDGRGIGARGHRRFPLAPLLGRGVQPGGCGLEAPGGERARALAGRHAGRCQLLGRPPAVAGGPDALRAIPPHAHGGHGPPRRPGWPGRGPGRPRAPPCPPRRTTRRRRRPTGRRCVRTAARSGGRPPGRWVVTAQDGTAAGRVPYRLPPVPAGPRLSPHALPAPGPGVAPTLPAAVRGMPLLGPAAGRPPRRTPENGAAAVGRGARGGGLWSRRAQVPPGWAWPAEGLLTARAARWRRGMSRPSPGPAAAFGWSATGGRARWSPPGASRRRAASGAGGTAHGAATPGARWRSPSASSRSRLTAPAALRATGGRGKPCARRRSGPGSAACRRSTPRWTCPASSTRSRRRRRRAGRCRAPEVLPVRGARGP
jgi:hypothetical protein